MGNEDGQHDFFRGHPGGVLDASLWPQEIAVAFVNGPTICMPPTQLAGLTDAQFARRRQRVLRRQHPLEDREISVHPLFDWPEDEEPSYP